VPWRLLERGTEWILAPKSELLELLSGIRRLPLKEAKIPSEEHKAVLLVVIGYRQKGVGLQIKGGGATRAGGLFNLDDLLSQGLVCDPSREVNFWRPTHVLGSDSNIALLPISEFSAKLLMSSESVKQQLYTD
jgi:hypothetical protein